MSSPPRTAELAAALRDLALPDDERIRALARVLPVGGAISHRTAAELHGFHLFGHREQQLRLPLQCTIPRGRERVRRPGLESYTSTLHGDVVLLNGLPVTSPERTALDVARYCTPDVAIAMLDRALRLRLVDRDALLDRIEELAGERWIAQARELVLAADPGAESPAESATRLRVVQAGFARPQTQVRVRRPDGRYFRLDMAWRALKVALEFDGREPHEDPAQRARDLWRRRWLTDQGWTVLVADKGDVYGTRMTLERAVGEVLGAEPTIRRRRW